MKDNFHLPNVPFEKQKSCLISIIKKQRYELLPLRRKVKQYEQRIISLEEELEKWKEKYGRLKKDYGHAERERERLIEEIDKLTKTNNRYQVALFDHGNFKDPLALEKRNTGGQYGHTSTNRELHEDYSLYEHKRLFSKVCSHCKGPLSRVKATKQKVLIDIILNPKVVKMILDSERQWCGSCKKEVNAKDKASLPFTEFGINTFMIVMILRFKSHCSFTSVSKVIEISHGLKLSKSDVSSILSQAKKYLRKQYNKLIEEIRKGGIMYNDETGWMVNGVNAWMWIMANTNKTVYFAAESRGKGIVEELYQTSTARSMHDGLASYQNTIPKDKQMYCWAHFLRFVHEETILEKAGSKANLLKEEIINIYRIKFNHPEYSKKKLRETLQRRLSMVLEISSENQTIINIQKRLKIQKEGLINSLLYTRDGTNNLAERELRTMVINKKISNGSKSFKGMENSAILGSIVQTTSKKENLIPKVRLYLQAGIREKYSQYSHQPFYDSS